MNEQYFDKWAMTQNWLNFLNIDIKDKKVDRYYVTPTGVILKVAFSQDKLVYIKHLGEYYGN